MLEIIMAIEDDGDRSFVEQLYIKYEKKLKMLAYGIVKNDSDAEDCVNDTFVKVIEYLDRYKDSDPVYTEKLISITCKNIALNLYGRKKRDSERQTSFDEEHEALGDSEYDPSRIAVNDYTKKLIIGLLGELDEKSREILILKYQYTMKNTEIAAIMGMTETAVSSRILRTKRELMRKGGNELYELFTV